MDDNLEPFKTNHKFINKNKSSSEKINSNLNLHFLNCMYTNADSLRYKIDELKIRLRSKSIQEIGIIGITEVNSKNVKFPVEIPEINIEKFDLISINIENNGSRGIALYIKKTV